MAVINATSKTSICILASELNHCVDVLHIFLILHSWKINGIMGCKTELPTVSLNFYNLLSHSPDLMASNSIVVHLLRLLCKSKCRNVCPEVFFVRFPLSSGNPSSFCCCCFLSFLISASSHSLLSVFPFSVILSFLSVPCFVLFFFSFLNIIHISFICFFFSCSTCFFTS